MSVAIERLGDGERLVSAPGDIGTVAGCESAVKTANNAFGGLDILVNSAGIGAGRPIEDCDEAMSDDHVDVNLRARSSAAVRHYLHCASPMAISSTSPRMPG